MGPVDGTRTDSAAAIFRWLRRLLLVGGFAVGAWILGSSLNTASAATTNTAHPAHAGHAAHAAGALDQVSHSTLPSRPVQPLRSVATGAVGAVKTAVSGTTADPVHVMERVTTHVQTQLLPTAQGILASTTTSARHLVTTAVDALGGAASDPAGTAHKIVTGAGDPSSAIANSLAGTGQTAPAPLAVTPPPVSQFAATTRVGTAWPRDVSGLAAETSTLEGSAGQAIEFTPDPTPPTVPPVQPVPDQPVVGGGSCQIHEFGSAVVPSRVEDSTVLRSTSSAPHNQGDQRGRAARPAVSPD